MIHLILAAATMLTIELRGTCKGQSIHATTAIAAADPVDVEVGKAPDIGSVSLQASEIAVSDVLVFLRGLHVQCFGGLKPDQKSFYNASQTTSMDIPLDTWSTVFSISSYGVDLELRVHRQ